MNKELALIDYISNISFKIEGSGYRCVGEQVTSSEMSYNWNSNPENPFRDLSYHRIYYVEAGGAQIITNSKTIELQQGEFYYFPLNTIIATRCENYMNHYFVHFTINDSVNFFQFFDYKNNVQSTELMVGLIKTITEPDAEKSMGEVFKADGALRYLFGTFFEKSTELNHDILKFKDVLQYIDDNLSNNIAIADLARLMNLSPVYFSYIFKDTLKITPIKYISEKRLVLAKQLLLNSDLSIKEIAGKCGFSEQYYFSNWFYKHTNIYPLKYRKQV